MKNEIIIQGCEFGLPCNLKLGSALKPYNTIHFENRRNKTHSYDDSNELHIKVNANPEIIEGREKCVFNNDEIERLKYFVLSNRSLIKDYLTGNTTDKGFLHFLRKKYANIPKQTPKHTLVFVKYDIMLWAAYSEKYCDISYRSKFGILNYHREQPKFSPLIFHAEKVAEGCRLLWPDFIKASRILEESKPKSVTINGHRFEVE